MPSVQWVARDAVTDDGVRLRFKVAGTGELSIVIMHGWGSTRNYFDTTIEQLDLNGLKVLAFDLRGHGESDAATSGYDPHRLARDMLHVAAAAGVERFVSVGHSMGAKFIQCLPLLAPGRVLGQVLVAGTPAQAIRSRKPCSTSGLAMLATGTRSAGLTTPLSPGLSRTRCRNDGLWRRRQSLATCCAPRSKSASRPISPRNWPAFRLRLRWQSPVQEIPSSRQTFCANTWCRTCPARGSWSSTAGTKSPSNVQKSWPV